MGSMDFIYVPCPDCGKENEFQTKGGRREFRSYHIFEDDIPMPVLGDVNRHSPIECEECEIDYKVKIEYEIETEKVNVN
jgi:hypothetical protein